MISLTVVTEGLPAECAQPLCVRVVWDGLDPAVRALRVSAHADVVLDGDHHEISGSRVTGELPVSQTSGDAEVEVVLPAAAPSSYVGQRFSIVWALDAVADIARGRDVRQSGPNIVVAAAGTRVRRLLESADPPAASGS